ncbi:MAG: AzlC family ABC transporter permease [Candidatus Competibacter sp.]|nr:AzlC family ABC transporter permease [Candidatus Competibacter sp.]
MKTHRLLDAARWGAQDSWPIMLAYLPLAFSFGLSSTQAGYSPEFAIAVSSLVFAGASQFALLSLLAAGTSGGGTVLVVFLMNLRHLFYGPALLTQLDARRSLPLPLLAFGLTDEVFATAMTRLASVPAAAREGWYLGLQSGAYGTWLAGTAAGALLGHDPARLTPWLREALAFILPAMFLALTLELGRHCSRSVLIASLAATGLLLSLTGSAGLAMLVGIIAGTGSALIPARKGSLDES